MLNSSLEQLRHSLAHLLGAAVLELYPGSKLAIGPAIEDGFYYDIDVAGKVSDDDLPKIEDKMREILKTWKSFESQEVSAKEAEKQFAGNQFKQELIADLKEKGEKITLYTSGNFTDLCRGGHVEFVRDIKPDAFKLSHVAGAYWRGNEKNPQLTRIYGLAFETKDDLKKHLAMLEEAKKRDHRKLGKELKLFTFDELVGPGLPIWLPKGVIIKDLIESFAKEKEYEAGYQRISTPHIAKEELFKMSGHLPYYADSMYPPMKLDDGNYYLKAMNCPITHLVYRSEPRSYRDLPLRLAEYGTVYRNELSGTLAGLLRVRMLSMNDAHIYCREDQLAQEFSEVIKLVRDYFKVFGLNDFYLRLSRWDPLKKEKYVNEPHNWNLSEGILRAVLEQSGMPFTEAVGEAAFYGPKIDVQYKFVNGREETFSTIQLDFSAKERFGLSYHDKDGQENKEVFVIHRAPLSTHERFIAILIEHYAGAFPLWLSPVQVAVITISDKQNAWGEAVRHKLMHAGIRVELHNQNETLGKKIRNAETQKIPYIFVVGDKEVEAQSVAIRKRGQGDLGSMPLDTAVLQLKEEIEMKK